MSKRLVFDDKHKVEYCVPTWVRDEQVKLACARKLPSIQSAPKRDKPIALVSYGPSLNDTWQTIRGYEHVMTCSGAHKFLLERGITPTWHVEVDPRPHKADLIGTPCASTTYLIASTCHPRVFDHLISAGAKVVLWHVFTHETDPFRSLPHGEWLITGGSSVGLRTLTLARFLGFTDLQVFGMDGNEGPSGKHAAAHPAQPKGSQEVEYPAGSGRIWKTTVSMLEVAKSTFHELDQMPDVRATFHGEGLVQEMAKTYTPNPIALEKVALGCLKTTLISAEYADLNRELHRTNPYYGVGGSRHADVVKKLAERLKTTSVLDYGCGKGRLAKDLPFPIWEYDPAIPGKDASPRPADIVVCTDVLEHVEPEKLDPVLADLARVTSQVAFLVIHTGPSTKHLADGRNAHLIQRDRAWWEASVARFFEVGKVITAGHEVHIVCAPKARPSKVKAKTKTEVAT